MRVLVVSGTAWPGLDGTTDDLLMVARPGDALHAHRFDLIVAPPPVRAADPVYADWYTQALLCRLEPDGRIVHT